MKTSALARFAASAGSVLLLAVLAVCPASAANPLNQPRGLALAANGDLYVANQSGNNILVFNTTYQYLPAKTITAGINKPSGVAIDTLGNIYVSNWASGQVTMYSSAGAQNTIATISGLNTPQGLAVDGIGNIYIDENYQDVKIYSANFEPTDSVPVQVGTYTPGSDIFAVATYNQFFAWGSLSVAQSQTIDGTLAGAAVFPAQSPAAEVLALAYNNSGNLYYCNANGTVDYANFPSGLAGQFATPGFTCEGIVVDNTRQRIYMSNQQGNSIAVYSTSGALLKTIQ